MAYKPPNDPLTSVGQATQEPRSLVIANEKPGTAQSVGVGTMNMPVRIIGGDGITVTARGTAYEVNQDIMKLEPLIGGYPAQQWVAAWDETLGSDDVRRIPVAAIPVDAPFTGLVYGRQNGAWVPAIENITIFWEDIEDKPDTFPPTLPIPSSGVTGLDAHQTAQDNAISANTGNIATNTTAIANNTTAIATETTNRTNADTALQADINGRVRRNGDEMTGPLVLPADPTAALEAATKQYVDSMIGASTSRLGEWNYSTQLTPPPNSGQVRSDTTTATTATHFYIANLTALGVDVSSLMKAKLKKGALLYIQEKASAATWAKVQLTADATAASGYFDAPVVYVEGSGTAIGNATRVIVDIFGGAGGGAAVFMSDTPPTNADPGNLWVETDSGGLYVRWQDPDSTSWVMLNAPGLPDAVADGKTYGRLNGAWVQSYSKSEADTLLAAKVPLAGTASYAGSHVNQTGVGGWFFQTGATPIAQMGAAGIYVKPIATNHAIQAMAITSASYAGVLGYGSDGVTYGALGFSGYGVYTNQNLISQGSVNSNGILYSLGSMSSTTGSAANVWQNSTSGNYARSTSSLTYKVDVEAMWDEIGDKVLAMRPIFYRSNPRLTIDDPEQSWYSFGAEDLGALDPRFAQWGREVRRDSDGKPIPILHEFEMPFTEDDGSITMRHDSYIKGYELEDIETPQGIQTHAVLAALVNLVQRQQKRIEALEVRLGI